MRIILFVQSSFSSLYITLFTLFYRDYFHNKTYTLATAAVANTRKLNIEYYNLYNCKPFFLGTNGVINH